MRSGTRLALSMTRALGIPFGKPLVLNARSTKPRTEHTHSARSIALNENIISTQRHWGVMWVYSEPKNRVSRTETLFCWPTKLSGCVAELKFPGPVSSVIIQRLLRAKRYTWRVRLGGVAHVLVDPQVWSVRVVELRQFTITTIVGPNLQIGQSYPILPNRHIIIGL